MEALSAIDLARLINQKSAPRGVLYVSGGGTQVLPMLLSQGGGSATLLSARIPYDPVDLQALIGRSEGSLVNAGTARELAMAAFRQALTLRGELEPGQVFGLGSTSKLARVPYEREGRCHEIHAAIHGSTLTLAWSVKLPVGIDRPTEEHINSLILLNLIARAKGVDRVTAVEFNGQPIHLDERSVKSDAYFGFDLPAVYEGRAVWVAVQPDGSKVAPQAPPRLLLSGSFRPLHEGHLQMARIASEKVGLPCDFEISLFHPEKPALDYITIASRLLNFKDISGLIYFSNAPTYIEKARLFPGCQFVVGHDTALRIIDPRFYGGHEARNAMLKEFESLSTRFLVFGRVDDEGQFQNFDRQSLQHQSVVDFLARCTQIVSEQDFRLDISSTVIRQQILQE